MNQKNTGGISGCNTALRQGSLDDGFVPNHRVVPNGNSFEDRDFRADPDTLSEVNGFMNGGLIPGSWREVVEVGIK